jgi:hypothetical protein
MEMMPVSSSTIAQVGYDPENQIMVVVFHNGTTYQYFDISAQIHTELMQSPSVGKYFAAAIRGHYRFARV